MLITILLFVIVVMSGGVGGAAMFYGRITSQKKQFSAIEMNKLFGGENSADAKEIMGPMQDSNSFPDKKDQLASDKATLLSDIFVGAVAALIGVAVIIKAFEFDVSGAYIEMIEYQSCSEATGSIHSEITTVCSLKDRQEYAEAYSRVQTQRYEAWLYLIALSLISGFIGIRLIENISNQVMEKIRQLDKKVDESGQAAREDIGKLYLRLDQEKSQLGSLQAERLLSLARRYESLQDQDATIKFCLESIAIKPTSKAYSILALAQSLKDDNPKGWAKAIDSYAKGFEINDDASKLVSFDMHYNRACLKNLLSKSKTGAENTFAEIVDDLVEAQNISEDKFKKNFALDILGQEEVASMDIEDKNLVSVPKGDLANLREKLLEISAFSKFK